MSLKSFAEFLAQQGIRSNNELEELIGVESLLIPKLHPDHSGVLVEAMKYLFNKADNEDFQVRHLASRTALSACKYLSPRFPDKFQSLIPELLSSVSDSRSISLLFAFTCLVSDNLRSNEYSSILRHLQPIVLFCASSNEENIASSLENFLIHFNYDVGPDMFTESLLKLLLVRKKSNETTKIHYRIAANEAFLQYSDQCFFMASDPFLYVKNLKHLPLKDEDEFLLQQCHNHCFSFHHPAFSFLSFFHVSYDILVIFFPTYSREFADCLRCIPDNISQFDYYLTCLSRFLEGNEPTPVDINEVIQKALSQKFVRPAIDIYVKGLLREEIDDSQYVSFFLSTLDLSPASAISGLKSSFVYYPNAQLFTHILKMDPIPDPSVEHVFRLIILVSHDFPDLIDLSVEGICKLIPLKPISSKPQLFELILNLPETLKPQLLNYLRNHIIVFSDTFLPYLLAMAYLVTDDQSYIIQSLLMQIIELLSTDFFYNNTGAISLLVYALRTLTMRLKKVSLPSVIILIPLYILRSCCSHLYFQEEIEEIEKYFEISTTPEENEIYDDIRWIVINSSFDTIIELRDAAAECVYSLKKHTDEHDTEILDLISDKLVYWPSIHIWRLLSNSSLEHTDTTHGIFSKEADIAIYAATKPSISKELYTSSSILRLYAYATGNGPEVPIIFEHLKIIDRYVDSLSRELLSSLEGRWERIAMPNHSHIRPISDLFDTDFSQWNGPKAFWDSLPLFLSSFALNKKICVDLGRCGFIHRMFIKEYPMYFEISRKFIKDRVELVSESNISRDIDLSHIPELEDIRLYREKLSLSLNYTNILTIPDSIPTHMTFLAEVYESLYTNLSYQIDDIYFYDYVHLVSELFCITKPKQKPTSLFRIACMPPYRGLAAQLIKYASEHRMYRCPVPDFDYDSFVNEREMIYLIPMCLSEEIKLSFAMKPLSSIVMGISAPLIKESAARALYMGRVPPYNPVSHEAAINLYKNNGPSDFLISTFIKWASQDKISRKNKQKITKSLTEILKESDVHWTNLNKTKIDKIGS